MNGPMEPNPEERERAAARRLELLHARLDRALIPSEAAELSRLLDRDPTAEAEAVAFDRLAQMARAARVRAPDDLVERVLAAAEMRPQGAEAPEAAPDARFEGAPDHTASTLRRATGPRRMLEALRHAISTPRLARPVLAGVLAAAVLALLMAALILKHAGRRAPQSGGAPAVQSVAHRFEFNDPEARKVCLVGDFNNWKVCEAPLRRDETTGVWTVQVTLPPGRHEYMFVVDDRSWVTDPAAPVCVDDGFGNQNAVLFL